MENEWENLGWNDSQSSSDDWKVEKGNTGEGTYLKGKLYLEHVMRDFRYPDRIIAEKINEPRKKLVNITE